jgi:hypothetical protein
MIAVAMVALAPMSIMAVSAPPEEPYFPEGVFDSEDKECTDSLDKFYTRSLRAMGEPSLWKLSKNDRVTSVFRLLWVPSFHHHISVRIVKSRGVVHVHAVELDGKGGLEPG